LFPKYYNILYIYIYINDFRDQKISRDKKQGEVSILIYYKGCGLMIVFQTESNKSQIALKRNP